MKDCFIFSLFCFILIVIVGILLILLFLSIVSAEMVTAISTVISTFIAAITVFYVWKQYRKHLIEEQTNLLCNYNQRYSENNDIRKVIEWIHGVVVIDKKGEVVDVDVQLTKSTPSLHEKEMFMRFFEEIEIQLVKNKMEPNSVFRLFAYYPLLMNRFSELRQDVTDYNSKKELDEIDNIENKKRMELNWFLFRQFIDSMKIEYKKVYGKEYED